jgi:hypothetical protein
MSSDGRFVSGFSARLFDFFFPTTGSSGAIQANAMSTQWQEFPDTLCRAPARQQFYNITAPGCVPFFPSGLEIVDAKDNATGFDLDFEAIESSYTMSCTSTATVVPFNDVTLVNQGAPFAIPTIVPIQPVDNPSITLAASVTSLLQSSLDLGHLRRAVSTTTSSSTSPSITDPAHLPERTLPQKLRKEPILNRRVEKRAEQPHAWCEETSSLSAHIPGTVQLRCARARRLGVRTLCLSPRASFATCAKDKLILYAVERAAGIRRQRLHHQTRLR